MQNKGITLKQFAHIHPRPQSALVQTTQEQKHRVILRMSRVFVWCKEGGFFRMLFKKNSQYKTFTFV